MDNYHVHQYYTILFALCFSCMCESVCMHVCVYVRQILLPIFEAQVFLLIHALILFQNKIACIHNYPVQCIFQPRESSINEVILTMHNLYLKFVEQLRKKHTYCRPGSSEIKEIVGVFTFSLSRKRNTAILSDCQWRVIVTILNLYSQINTELIALPPWCAPGILDLESWEIGILDLLRVT